MLLATKSPKSKYLPNGSTCCNISNPNPNRIRYVEISIFLSEKFSIFSPQTRANIKYIIKCINLSNSNNLNLGKPRSGTGISESSTRIKE